MAGVKISDLPSGGTLTTESVFPVVANPALAAQNRITYKFTVLQLLNLITVASSGRVFQGAADPPVAAPNDPGTSALYYPNGGGTLYQWDVVSQTWL